MDKRLKKFLKRDSELKAAMEQGKDIYAIIASKLYHNEYEDNLGYSKDRKYTSYASELRRNNAKWLVLAAFMGDISYLDNFTSEVK